MSEKTIPGAVILNGVQYLPGPKGTLVPVENIRAQDLLQHEMVYQLTDFALDLSAEIARFNGHSRADTAQYDALLAQEYGVTRDPDFKGNRTYTSADGQRQVKMRINDRVIFGPELQAAKALLDELITENADGAGPVLTPLVNLAFRVDKEGKVDPDLLRAIRRLEIPDHRWTDICRAIDDAERVIGTTSTITFYRTGPTGKLALIPLDIANATPTPEAFARRSLRRQVEELEARIAELTVIDDTTPFHHVVAAGVALRFDFHTMPVTRRLSAAVYLVDSARDILREIDHGGSFKGIVSQADQDGICDAVDHLNDIHISLSEIIEHLPMPSASQAAE